VFLIQTSKFEGILEKNAPKILDPSSTHTYKVNSPLEAGREGNGGDALLLGEIAIAPISIMGEF
jgi:hypothetical protein